MKYRNLYSSCRCRLVLCISYKFNFFRQCFLKEKNKNTYSYLIQIWYYNFASCLFFFNFNVTRKENSVDFSNCHLNSCVSVTAYTIVVCVIKICLLTDETVLWTFDYCFICFASVLSPLLGFAVLLLTRPFLKVFVNIQYFHIEYTHVLYTIVTYPLSLFYWRVFTCRCISRKRKFWRE